MDIGEGPSRRAVMGLLGGVPLAASGVLAAAGTARARPAGRRTGAAERELAARIDGITGRPEFAGARWGMACYAPDTGAFHHALRPDELFTAGSAFKVFVAGTAFERLGAEHRFRTRVYGTGPVVRGVLRGDLVLVAGGDLLLSGRTRPDGTLELPERDPSYPGGAPLSDPLREIRDLAAQVAAAGVRRVDGRVRVDVSLFREVEASAAIDDQRITVSPIMVNEHVVHAVVTPGSVVGAPAVVRAFPENGHVRFDVRVTTAAASGPVARLGFCEATTGGDGTVTVPVTGEVPVGGPVRYQPYFVREPARYAATLLAEALTAAGVPATPGGAAGSGYRRHGRRLAEHVSPPLAESSKVMLKVSSNVHTVTFPRLVGAVAGHDPVTPEATYERYRDALFHEAGVHPDRADQAEGLFTADTFVRFLALLRHRPYFPAYHRALPIMGRDGTIAGNQPDSPAAGHVFAKTGTAVRLLPSGEAEANKSLAGYVHLPDGRWVTFAQFMAGPTTRDAVLDLTDRTQEAMAEIATAIHQTLGGR
ncbi:D-alanyl-D-alanine carboxypeptidase/D-alanyl-D-alanine endopeptidase [Streptomyces hainanensis]|nr:D-alanyl-D-alanine carboxypeptidase/D-alanyl-D-alanine-endopeptidase [Streptomyces hainanensis]